ncbi:MAG TPA: hypothetical protein VMU57_00365 [Edaphobacter sp.]|uniref:hypothetical protein n=1 Tax=Edaphobacter sp. TaxID=1934404 RepID=UPI002C114EA5|nr:hypothetical protein [Edaphobacter sp.]HUZ93343.1 hypothetical protein [Edaphobacter sp.]
MADGRERGRCDALAHASYATEPAALFAFSLTRASHPNQSATRAQHIPRYGVQSVSNFGEEDQLLFG